MRAARSRISLLNSVLPGMFAAGVDYELLLPYLDSYITATVRGDASREIAIRAPSRKKTRHPADIYALIAREQRLNSALIAAIRTERQIGGAVKAAVRVERELSCYHCTAILGQPELAVGIMAAVRVERNIGCFCCAAIQAEPDARLASAWRPWPGH